MKQKIHNICKELMKSLPQVILNQILDKYDSNGAPLQTHTNYQQEIPMKINKMIQHDVTFPVNI